MLFRSLYLPLGRVAGVSGELLALAVSLAVVSELTGILAASLGATRRYDGPMGKSDRAFVFGLLALILGFGIDPAGWVNAAMGAVSLLLIVTIVNRARRALAELQEAR